MARTQDEINSEYGTTCAKLGDLIFKDRMRNQKAQSEMNDLLAQLDKLNSEANEVASSKVEVPDAQG